MLLAQLVGDGQVAAHVAEADGRGEVERPLATSRCALPLLGGVARDAGQVSSSTRLTATGSRPAGAWPVPSKVTSVRRVSSASRSPTWKGITWSSVPCTTTTGQRTSAHRSATGREPDTLAISARTMVAASVGAPRPPGPRSAWSSAPRAPSGRRRSRGSPGSRGARSAGCSAPSPRRRPCPRPSARRPAAVLGNAARPPMAGQIATQAATRSGWSAARSSAYRLPIDNPTTTARRCRWRRARRARPASSPHARTPRCRPGGRTRRCRAGRGDHPRREQRPGRPGRDGC